MENYLRECVDSILNQTYKNLEIILVNDGSTDSSADICEEYANADSRIRVIHKENGGLSSARNMGLDNAHGHYVGFVDSDDYITCDMYERLINACIDNKAPIAICHAITFKDGRKPLNSCGYIKRDYCSDDMKHIMSNALLMSQSVCNKLFHKNLFHNIRFPLGRVVEDGYIIYDLLYRAKKVAYVSIGGYYYRQREDSITTRKYVTRDMDFVLCNIRSYYRVKKMIPELWEEGLCRSVYNGFLPVLKKMVLLEKKEFRRYRKDFLKIGRALTYLEEDLQQSTRIKKEDKEYVLSFIDNPWKLYDSLNGLDISIGEEKSKRVNQYDTLVDQWENNREKGIRIVDYFVRNNIESIAIYGFGTLGEMLYNDIKDEGIAVRCFIDRAADNYLDDTADVLVITPETISKIDAVDVIVVTPIHVYDSIEQTIRDNGYLGKVVSLEKIICEG